MAKKRAARSRSQGMALAFAAGSIGFLIGPFPGYVALVGPVAGAITFFVGSVLYTAGGWSGRLHARPGRRELDHSGGRGLLPGLRGHRPGRRGGGPATLDGPQQTGRQ